MAPTATQPQQTNPGPHFAYWFNHLLTEEERKEIRIVFTADWHSYKVGDERFVAEAGDGWIAVIEPNTTCTVSVHWESQYVVMRGEAICLWHFTAAMEPSRIRKCVAAFHGIDTESIGRELAKGKTFTFDELLACCAVQGTDPTETIARYANEHQPLRLAQLVWEARQQYDREPKPAPDPRGLWDDLTPEQIAEIDAEFGLTEGGAN